MSHQMKKIKRSYTQNWNMWVQVLFGNRGCRARVEVDISQAKFFLTLLLEVEAPIGSQIYKQ